MQDIDIDDATFEKLIAESLDELPEQYTSNLQNVAITYEDDPSPAQREQLKLHCNQTLFGLYEGLPRNQRAGYSSYLPDKITLFKGPLLSVSNSMESLKINVKHTLWHEIAHYYGLNHARIHEIERNM